MSSGRDGSGAGRYRIMKAAVRNGKDDDAATSSP